MTQAHKTIVLCMALMAILLMSISSKADTNRMFADRPYTDFQNVAIPIDLGMVQCMLHDHDGMMWFGTRGGLCSWNGYQLHTYTPSFDPNARFVNCLLDSNGDDLYVGTDLGLLAFDKRLKTFRTLPCTSLTEDARQIARIGQCLYIGTASRGIICYDTMKRTSRVIAEAMRQMKALAVVDGRLYAGYYNGLVSMDADGSNLRHEQISRQVKINSIYYDNKSQTLYIATDGQGFMSYSLRQHTIEKIAESRIRHAKVVTADSRGHILCGTEEGLYVYSPATRELLQSVHDSRRQSSLCNDMVRSIATDGDGNVFVGTDHGVSVYPLNELLRIVPLSSITGDGHGNLLTSLLYDGTGSYWIGGEHGLIHIEKGGRITRFSTSSPTHQLRTNYIRSIYKDSEGHLWIATDDGVARYNPQSDQFEYYEFQSRDGSSDSRWSYEFAEDEQGRLWIASYFGGLFVVDKRRIEAARDGRVVADTVVLGYRAYQVRPLNGHTMAANTEKGIAFVDTRSLKVTQTRAFDDNMVVFYGNVWYSSMGRLYRLNARGESVEMVYDRGADSKIHSFAVENNRLWFSTSTALYYCKAQKDGKSAGNDYHVYRYTSSSQAFMAGMKYGDGEQLLWVGNDCLGIVPIASVGGRAQNSRHIAVTALLYNGAELVADSDYQITRKSQSACEIRLSMRGNIQLELSQFDYAGAAASEYYYQIDGDKTWSKTESGSNTLSLVALSGGRHTLRFSSSNPQIDPQATIDTLVLIVPHPWYATWQAIVLYITGVLLLIALIIRHIVRRNRRRYEQRERERVLELSSLKMDFFVNISHELKTPLSLIVAPVGRLMAELKDGRAREQLAIVEKNALRLNSLIRKILDFKRLEYESEDTLMLTRIDLCDLLRGSMANFAASAEQREIEMELQSDVETLTIDVDVIKIESIMANLLSNALRHVADHEGRVTVALSLNAGRIDISVADNGPGVSERELPMLFERYFHGDAISTGSSGIGLHLVKKFTELHGGTVAARNDGGLRVTVSLPYNEAQSPQPQNLITPQPQNQITPEPQNLITPQPNKLILIVDDNSEILDFISQSLAADFDCLTARDGVEALEMIGNRQPDIAIIDQMMPRMDGMTLARRLRANVPTATLPIIMLTAKDDNQTEMESLQTGVDVFLSKPFSMHKLQLHIVRLLKSRQTIEQCRRITEMANPQYAADEASPSTDEALLQRINEIIDSEMSRQGFTVEALAEATNLSTKSLYRKVKQLTGVTPVKYIMRLRMKKAQALLSGQGFTAAEVCYMVGLSNPSYFTKCFTEEFGVSPKEYAAHN